MNEQKYELSWSQLKSDWPVWLLLLVSFVAGITAYPLLPDQVPIHWNLQGEADGFGSRWLGAFGLPLVNLGLYIFLRVLPLVDPRRENYTYFIRFYSRFILVFMAAMTIFYLAALWAGLGKTMDIGWTVLGTIAVLFIFMGNSMGKVRPNYFVGIRTPWTLANERVWQKTHRWSGRLFVITGVLPLLAMLFSREAAMYALIGAALISAAGSVIYSYIVFRQETS